MKIHTVETGDSVYSIAMQYGVSPDSIIQNNGLNNPDSLAVGQTLVIRIPKTEHTVTGAETLCDIARNYRTSPRHLYRNNPNLADHPDIVEGDTLVIEYDQDPKRCIAVNGIVHSGTDTNIVKKWLSGLTYITPFSYGFQENGGLVPINDAELINLSQSSGVDSILLLSTLNSEGKFDNSLSHQLLGDTEMQDYLLSQVLSQMEINQSRVLALDFQFLFSEDKAAYPAFISKAKKRLAPYGYEVWVTLPPQTVDGQEGALFEGIDQSLISNVADRLLLMTYEWGYRYGENVAVAPINEIRKALDYTLRYASADQILLGIPNYGYDFTISDEHSISAEMLSAKEAVERASEQNAMIRYDADAEAPYYHYYKNGIRHEVFFEDARSFQAKLDLVDENNLYGISIWNIESEFPEALMLLTPYCIE